MVQIHIFCDASEHAYGSVAYLRAEDDAGKVHVAFLIARSRVAPKRQLSIPRLELCAALSGAQIAALLQKELTLPIENIFLWSDSTVLQWINSDSCRYKVFVGTRVAEIQDLTSPHTWHYVSSTNNPADDITRGKSLQDLIPPNRWHDGPLFLHQSSEQWPQHPVVQDTETELKEELRKSALCALTLTQTTTNLSCPDVHLFPTYQSLLEATAQRVHGAADPAGTPSADDFRKAENIILQQAQQDSFRDEINHLKAGKPVPQTSRLSCLATEFDNTTQLIRVGGRLRQATHLDTGTMHPIVLDPKHPVTQRLIQHIDAQLCHPGPERVFQKSEGNTGCYEADKQFVMSNITVEDADNGALKL